MTAESFSRGARRCPSDERAVEISARPPVPCQSCGSTFAQNMGSGRPRRYCRACRPPDDPLAATRNWRADNREAVNAATRARYRAVKSSPVAAPRKTHAPLKSVCQVPTHGSERLNLP